MVQKGGWVDRVRLQFGCNVNGFDLHLIDQRSWVGEHVNTPGGFPPLRNRDKNIGLK